MERAAVPSMIREQRLNQWIEDYSDSILRTCFLYLSDQNQAEDATQDTWIKAWKHMDDYERKSIANDKAWLLRIAINTCKDYRRSAWFRHVDRSKALDKLPEKEKAAIALFYFEDRSIKEISAILNMPQGTVKYQLSMGRTHLKQHIQL